MRLSLLTPVLLPVAAQAVNIVLCNDDGWAEINLRTLYKSLTGAGDSVIVSAPAVNESGASQFFICLTNCPLQYKLTCFHKALSKAHLQP